MQFRNRNRRTIRAALVSTVLLGVGASADAATMSYQLVVPDGRATTYRLELDVRHPGALVVAGEWEGPRTLAFRLEHPDGRLERTVRRTGPSPLRLVAEIEEGGAGIWKLQIHALAASGAVDGTLTIETPEPRPVLPPPTADSAQTGPAVEDEPWLLPRRVPPGLPGSWTDFLDKVESFRVELSRPMGDAFPDSCRWQSPLMRYLAQARDELLEGRRVPDRRTRRFLQSLSDAVDAVESLRTSNDPMLVGPPPEDRSLRDAWRKIRTSRLHEIEDQLDDLFRMIRRGHVPGLEGEEWTMRLISCLTACERFFDQRSVVGRERASNRDLAENQWERVRMAGKALGSLAAVEGRGAIR